MDPQQITELQKVISGVVASAGETIYEKASKMMMRTIHPGAVVQPKDAQDVAQTVLFAKKHHIPFAIRSGGHHSIATRLKDGILLIDMSAIASVEVIDRAKGLVRVGAGALWYDVATELEKNDLAISSGDTRSVGVGGLATGGGIGWMVRKYGLLLDNTASIEIVTADGQVRQANKDENSDLFWAVRGGGSNFGVVTHFTFQAHRVEGVYIGHITYPLEHVGEVIKSWRDAMRQAPPELTTILTTLPSFGQGPASISIAGCFDGTDETAATAAYAPLLRLGGSTPLSHSILPKPYSAVLEEAHPPAGMRVIVHNTFIKDFSEDAVTAIDSLFKNAAPLLQIRHIGGAMNQLPIDESAFAFRDSEVLIVSPSFVPPDAPNEAVEKATSYWKVIEAFGHGHYLNLLSYDTGKEAAEAFPPETMERLVKIKTKYDPANIFDSNYNIKPAFTDVTA